MSNDWQTYPHQSGIYTILGPETFSDAGKTVICHMGENYYPRLTADDAAEVIFTALGAASVCWSEPGPGESIFQSELASAIGRGLLTVLGYPIPDGYQPHLPLTVGRLTKPSATTETGETA